MSRHLRRRRAQRGFSLTEMLIVTGLVASLFGTLLLLGQRASASTNDRTAEDQARVRVEGALARLARELADAGLATLNPTAEAPFWADTLTFQSAAGFDESGAVWSAPRRIELVDDPSDPDNGRDDDGDGTIDEHILRLVTDEGRIVVLANQVRELAAGELANGEDDDGDGLVDEAGFSVSLEGTSLRLELAIEREDAHGGTASAAGVTRLWLENE